MSRRNGAHPSGETMPSSRSGAGGQGDSLSALAGGKKIEQQEGWTDKHVSIVQEAIFVTLAGLARDALKAERSARAQVGGFEIPPSGGLKAERADQGCVGSGSTPSLLRGSPGASGRKSQPQPHLPPSTNAGTRPSDAAPPPPLGSKRKRAIDISSTDSGGHGATTPTGGGVLLFNEQYVVKPPRSSIEFGWHTASVRRSQSIMIFACLFYSFCSPRFIFLSYL